MAHRYSGGSDAKQATCRDAGGSDVKQMVLLDGSFKIYPLPIVTGKG